MNQTQSPPSVDPEPPPTGSALDVGAARIGRLWIEVVVVLAVMWLPAMFNSVASLIWFSEAERQAPPPPFAYDMIQQVIDAVRVAAPVLFIMWLSGDGWVRFGIKRFSIVKDLALTAGLYAAQWVAWFGYWVAWHAISPPMIAHVDAAGTMDLFSRPQSAADHVLLVAGCLAIGVQEELAVRAFLLPRFEELLGSPWKAVALSALVFASYHAYQHPLEMASTFVTGLVFGAAFIAFRRIWPLILTHAVIDALSLGLA